MTEAEAMEADVEVVREFQEHVENSRPGRRGVYIVQSKADDLDAALTRISDRLIEVTGERNTAQYERDMLAHSRDDYADRLQRYEAVVDAAERLLDPPIRVGSERLHGQDNDIGVLRAALNALASPATQETGE